MQGESAKERFSDVEAIGEGALVANTRAWGFVDPDAVYTPIDADSEDDLYDMMDECEPSDVLYLELGEGAADVLIRMDGFMPNPIAVRGDPAEIAKAQKYLARTLQG